MKRLAWFVLVVVAAQCVVTPAFAGQLFTSLYGLADVVQQPGVALLGTVVAVNAAKGSVKLLVKRVWKTEEGRLQVSRRRKAADGTTTTTALETLELEPGKTVELPVNQGVVWDDPHKSPIDHRLRGHLALEKVKKGDEVLYLRDELAAPTAAELRKLALFFEGKVPGEYPAKAGVETLVADLADFDLAPLAYAELDKREELTPERLLFVPDLARRNEAVYRRWKALDQAGQERFLADAADVLARRPAPDAALLLLRTVAYELRPGIFAPVVRLMRLLDPKQKDATTDVEFACRKLEELYLADRARTPNPEVVRFLAARHANDVVAFAEQLTKDERALVLDDLFARSADGLRQRKATAGLEAFRAAAELAAKEPDARWANALAGLKLETVPFPARTDAALTAVRLANALAKHDSMLVKVLEPSMEALLASEEAHMNKVGSGDLEMSVGISIPVESQIGGDEVDEYRRLFRGQK